MTRYASKMAHGNNNKYPKEGSNKSQNGKHKDREHADKDLDKKQRSSEKDQGSSKSKDGEVGPPILPVLPATSAASPAPSTSGVEDSHVIRRQGGGTDPLCGRRIYGTVGGVASPHDACTFDEPSGGMGLHATATVYELYPMGGTVYGDDGV